MACTSSCRNAGPGHCACECKGTHHGALASAQQLTLSLPPTQSPPYNEPQGNCVGELSCCVSCGSTFPLGSLTLARWHAATPAGDSPLYYDCRSIGELCSDCFITHWASKEE